MSGPTATDVERVACPYCGAPAGSACYNWISGELREPHRPREEAFAEFATAELIYVRALAEYRRLGGAA